MSLSGADLQGAIEWNPRVVMLINPGTGAAEDEFYDPRSGKARDHRYLSAALTFYIHPSQQGRAQEEFVGLWADAIQNKQPRPCVDVVRFEREKAVALPEIFVGEHDRIWDYDGSGFERIR